jgi:ABC-type xylose transport system permease subunit
MNSNRNSAWTWLVAVVLIHLVISMVHALAHVRARAPLSYAASVFVYVVILAGPLVGLAVAWWNRRAGSWVIALTMTGSFVFGVVNHFILSGPDHVAHVDPQWRPLFTVTAVLVAVTEALAAGLAAKFLASERVVVANSAR